MAFNFKSFEYVTRDVSSAWLTLPEIADQLNLFGDDSQDAQLLSLDLVARMHIENYLGVSFFASAVKAYYDSDVIDLDLPTGGGGATITSVKYWDSSIPSVLTTVSTGNYQLDPTGKRVLLNSLIGGASQAFASPVQVTYAMSMSALAAYPTVRHAGLLLLTHFYNQRSQTTELVLKEIPFGVATLLRPFKELVM